MKLIVLGVPHTQTTRAFNTCPFTIKAWNQCRMLQARGHEVIHIGVEGSDPPCSESVAAISRDEWAALYSHPGAQPYNTRTDGPYAPYQKLYAERVRRAIDERVSRPWEAIVACTWGDAQIVATKGLAQFVVESGVGYRHTWAKYRVFVSYAWMHFHYGLEQKFAGNGWYDAVIPNEVDLELFGDAEGLGLGARAGESGPMVPIGLASELTLGPALTPIPGPDLPSVAGQVRSGRVGPRSGGSATGGGASATTGRGFGEATTVRGFERSDEFLFMGRLNDDKGVAIAVDVARRAGRRLLIVGQGDPARFLAENPHVRYLPPVDVEGRRRLMAEAAALVCPTQYVEPLGNVALEAQASGTPVICTDWGGFTETVLHGVTGYRCRTMEQFVWAAKNIDRIDPAACRRWVADNFSTERVGQMFEEYYQMLLDLAADGWYTERPERVQLDWLAKRYPAG
jgi:glycosyltransferase involved in cell wall biosynthesis